MANQKFLIGGHKSQTVDNDASTAITITASDELPITYYIKRIMLVFVSAAALQDSVYITGVVKPSDSFDSVLYSTTYLGGSLDQRTWTFPTLTGRSGAYFRPISHHYTPFVLPHQLSSGTITLCEIYCNIRIQKGSLLEIEFYLDSMAGTAQAGTEDFEISVFAEAVVA